MYESAEWPVEEYEFRLRQLDIFLRRNIITPATYEMLKNEYQSKVEKLKKMESGSGERKLKKMKKGETEIG